MKKETIIHEFDPVIYPVKIWVCISPNLEDLKIRFKEKSSGKDLSFDAIDECDAFSYFVKSKETNKNGILISFLGKKYCHAGNITHESTHAAMDIFDHIEEKETGGEAYAYLVGWIAECCEKVKNNKV